MAKNIVVVEVKPPIPTHGFDFCAYLEGTEEGGLFGWGDSEESAREDLRVLLVRSTLAGYFEPEIEEEEDAEVEE